MKISSLEFKSKRRKAWIWWLKGLSQEDKDNPLKKYKEEKFFKIENKRWKIEGNTQ